MKGIACSERVYRRMPAHIDSDRNLYRVRVSMVDSPYSSEYYVYGSDSNKALTAVQDRIGSESIQASVELLNARE